MICDRCGGGKRTVYYTEAPDPRTQAKLTFYCCKECQEKLCRVMLGFVAAQLPMDEWAKKYAEGAKE